MDVSKTNIVLIGMAGCGKSTIGRLLADCLSRGFVDTDALIEQSAGCPLQEYIDSRGTLEFRQLEEDILLRVNQTNAIIATGGSSIYSHRGMMHLKEEGGVIFLDVALELLQERVQNLDTRGLVKRPEQNFAQLFAERLPFYMKYADITVACDKMNSWQICEEITRLCKAQE